MKYAQYQLKYPIAGDYGVGLTFTDKGGTKWQAVAPQMPRELEISITTHIGVSPGAEHFYGKLTSKPLKIICIESKDSYYRDNKIYDIYGGIDNYKPIEIIGFNIQLRRYLTKAEVEIPKWKNLGYTKDTFTEAFKSSYDIIDEATRIFKIYFDIKAWKLVPKEKAYINRIKKSLKYPLHTVLGG
jgi:hypothetical protein